MKLVDNRKETNPLSVSSELPQIARRDRLRSQHTHTTEPTNRKLSDYYNHVKNLDDDEMPDYLYKSYIGPKLETPYEFYAEPTAIHGVLFGDLNRNISVQDIRENIIFSKSHLRHLPYKPINILDAVSNKQLQDKKTAETSYYQQISLKQQLELQRYGSRLNQKSKDTVTPLSLALQSNPDRRHSIKINHPQNATIQQPALGGTQNVCQLLPTRIQQQYEHQQRLYAESGLKMSEETEKGFNCAIMAATIQSQIQFKTPQKRIIDRDNKVQISGKKQHSQKVKSEGWQLISGNFQLAKENKITVTVPTGGNHQTRLHMINNKNEVKQSKLTKLDSICEKDNFKTFRVESYKAIVKQNIQKKVKYQISPEEINPTDSLDNDKTNEQEVKQQLLKTSPSAMPILKQNKHTESKQLTRDASQKQTFHSLVSSQVGLLFKDRQLPTDMGSQFRSLSQANRQIKVNPITIQLVLKPDQDFQVPLPKIHQEITSRDGRWESIIIRKKFESQKNSPSLKTSGQVTPNPPQTVQETNVAEISFDKRNPKKSCIIIEPKKSIQAKIKSPLKSHTQSAKNQTNNDTEEVKLQQKSTTIQPQQLLQQQQVEQIAQPQDQTPTTTNNQRPRNRIVNEFEEAENKRNLLLKKQSEAKEMAQQYSLLNKNQTKLKYSITAGNNSAVIRKCMMLREERWEETNDFDKLFNLRWQPFSRGLPFSIVNTCGTRQLVNHIQNHDILTTKHMLFENMAILCEMKKLDVFNYMPLTFTVQMEHDTCGQEFQKFLTYFQNLTQCCKIEEQNQKFGINLLLPQAFKIQEKTRQPQSAKYILPKSHYKGQNVWILKATGFNRGIGIHVFNKLEQLQKLLVDYSEFSGLQGAQDQIYNCIAMTQKCSENTVKVNNPGVATASTILQSTNTTNTSQSQQPIKEQSLRSTSFIIQKYMEGPLLINERKFDIRVWVLINQSRQVFMFKQGYIRTSSQHFTLDQDSILRPEIHLTNNAIQSKFQDYGKFESGNQLSFDQFQAYLDSNGGQPDFVNSNLIPSIQKQIMVSVESVKSQLQVGKGFFELFGYDFLVDEDYECWLIEVNTNPCLEESSPLLQTLIPRMVNDMLRLTVDQAFGPIKGQNQYDQSQINVFDVPQYDLNENMWQQLMTLPVIQQQSKITKQQHKVFA